MACRGSGVRVPVAPPTRDETAEPSPLAGAAGGEPSPEDPRDQDQDRPARTEPASEPHTHVERYDPSSIEPRWQARWAELGLHDTDLVDDTRPKYYLLTMYPYPSGDLHIGHWYIVTPSDALARFRRMHGYNVFFPIGFDAFGLPAENAAIKNGGHPFTWTMQNIENMRRQFRTMGATFAWKNEVVTADPSYYRLEPVAVPALPGGRPGLPGAVRRRLVPERRDAGARAGRGHGPPLLALRRPGREARPGAVVPAHDRVRGRAARLLRHRLARADQDPADELDRPVRGRRDRLRGRARRLPAGRRPPARVHDPPGHAVRGDLHGRSRRSTRWSRS